VTKQDFILPHCSDPDQKSIGHGAVGCPHSS